MLDTVSLKFGSSGNATSLDFEAQTINVFVGPNNSGKSIALQELAQVITNKFFSSVYIIRDIEFKSFSREKITKAKEKYILETTDDVGRQFIRWSKGGSMITNLVTSQIDEALLCPKTSKGLFRSLIAESNFLTIDGIKRLELVNGQQSTGLGGNDYPRGALDLLFRNDEKRHEVRNILFRAFNKYFVINPTYLGQLSISFSERPPAERHEEIGIDQYACKFHSAAIPIRNFSDGVKAYTGLIVTVVSQDEELILIDEPEAFLHPKLAFQLGNELGRLSSSKEKQFFIATHSSDFILGCLQSKVPINVIRLTYQNNLPTARILEHHALLKLLRNPILRSSNVLRSLFYDFVVVTEGDSDRAFYQEINERLLSIEDNRGIPNCLFINAQNKQTIESVISPLRKLGVPAAAIVDIDILKEGGKPWVNFLNSGFIPDMTIKSLVVGRTNIMQKFNSLENVEMKKKGGIDLLSAGDKEACNNLFDQIEEYGLFVVRKGELESWLKEHGVNGHGTTWLVNMFDKMGDDPNSSSFSMPGKGDVWDFIGSINKWFQNSFKKGIPD